MDGYHLIDDLSHDRLFMADLGELTYLSGKSLAMLRRIAPDHTLFVTSNKPPRLRICLYEHERQEMMSECAAYIGRAREMIKHKLHTR